MNKASVKRSTIKSLKVTGAALSLGWSIMGAAAISFGAVLAVREKSRKLGDALNS